MQNIKPTHFPVVADHPSAVSDVVDRVVGIAPAPLLPGEREADYVNLIARVVVAVARPRDAIEEFLTRDVIDLTWEILRLRRMKVGLLRASMGRGIESVMRSLGYNPVSAGELAAGWASGEKSAKNEVAGTLQKAQLAIEDVMAKTLEGESDSFERFDRILASSEARRNNALREIDRHRAALGGAVRQAIDEVQDAEFRDVDTGEVGGTAPP
jgi:hypothetical protein